MRDIYMFITPRNNPLSLRAPLLTVILREQSDRRISPLRAGSSVAIIVPSESEESRFEIAELVPSETRNLMLQFVSATPRNDKKGRTVTNYVNEYVVLHGPVWAG